MNDSSSNFNPDDWLEIGTIVAAQGLKGELRVATESDFPERFEAPGKRWLKSLRESEPQPVELLTGYQIPGKSIYVVKLAGIEDRTRAETLKGYKLLVLKSDRPQLAEDEYHASDLIDLEVYDRSSGESIGVVIDLLWAGNDLLEIELHQQFLEKIVDRARNKPEKKPGRVFIPFVKEIVPVVDIKAGRLEIDPPPGLLEINQN